MGIHRFFVVDFHFLQKRLLFYMTDSIIFSVLNAKYVHASPAPWCLAAGIKAYAPSLIDRVHIVESTINRPLSETLARLLEFSPAIVCFSCYIWNITETLELCRALKGSCPGTVIALGGPEVSYCPLVCLEQKSFVVYVICGQGSESVPLFSHAIGAWRRASPL